MSLEEPLARLAVVALALAVGVGVGRWTRRRSRRARAVVVPSPLPPGVHLFTGERCASCDPVRRLVTEMLGHGPADPAAVDPRIGERPGGGPPVHEIVWEEAPEAFAAAGIRAVPTVVVVGGEGEVLGAWEGRPPPRRLRRTVAKLRAVGGRE